MEELYRLWSSGRIMDFSVNSCFLVSFLLAAFTGCNNACPTGCHCVDEAPYLTSCIDQNFTEIPSGIPLYTKELYMKGNRIKTLSEGAFRDLISLQRLVFTHNKLESLEANAFIGLVDLIHLDLRSNNIASLPSYAFSGLPNLKILEMDFNDIETIAESAFKDLNLTKLGLENNRKLVEIHTDAFQDSSLINLYLFGSNLQSRSAEALRSLRSSLQELSWQKNQQPISFQEDLFQGFTLTRLNLENIGLRDASFLKHVRADGVSLAGNPIGPIDFSRFPLLYSVRSLHLEDTRFSHLEPGYFRNLSQLDSLHLQNNGITTLDENMKSVFSRIRSLKLDGNPFHCNCELIWFRRWLASPDFDGVTGAACSTPFSEELRAVDEGKLECSAPRIINITTNDAVQESMLTVTCIAEGDPAPDIHWELPDGRLKTYNPSYNRTETVVRRDIRKVAELSDAGTYNCVAVNLLGNDSSVAIVEILPFSSDPSSTSAAVSSRSIGLMMFMLFNHAVAIVMCF